ncbi:MAG: T9SS type A sorting domain-containing protein [Bacteroidota bacterium]
MKTPLLKRKLFNFFSAFLLLFMTSPVLAQLAAWNPAGLSSYGPSPWAPTSSNASLTVGGLTRGAGIGLTGSPAASAWGGVNWAGAANQDATFTVAANPGFSVSYSTFNLSYRRSNTGPNAGTFEYTFGSSTTYTVISAINNFTSTVTSGVLITPINLSGVADLQNVPPGTVVKFRIFPTGGSSVGTWYVSGVNGMSINGTVAPIASTFSTSIIQTASVSCNGQSNAALTANVTGGTMPYTYSWTPSVSSSSVATGLAAGVYTCLVTSATSATAMSTYTVTEPAVLSSSISAQNNVSCHGGSNGSATVSVTGGTAPYTYSWTPAVGTASVVNALSANNYTLNITDAHNCTLPQFLMITEPAILNVTANASSLSVCNGSTVSLTGGGATTYTWTGGVTNGVAFSPSATTVYTVNGTDGSGCTGLSVISVTVNALPTLTVQALPSSTVCAGASVSLTGTGANTYTWTGGVTNGVSFSPSATSVYTVTGTSANGCTNTAVQAITVNTLPVITASVSPSATLCAGATATLTGGGATTYTWTGGVTDGISFSPSATTVYTVTGTSANGCTNTAVQTITVNTLPVITTSVSPSATLCAGTSATLTGGGATTYTWTGGVTNGASFSPSASTIYTVNGTGLNGCNSSTVIAVTVNAMPSLTVQATPSFSVCLGTAVTLNGSGATTYTWTGGVTNGVSFTPATSATYTLTGASANGCTNTAVRSLTVNSLPTVTATASNSVICNGSPVTLSGAGASTYSWTSGVTNGAPFNPSATLSYTVTGTDVNGCSNTAVKTITVNALPALGATTNKAQICAGQTATITALGALTYTWSTNQNTAAIAVTPSITTTYTVSGTSANGCIGTVAFTQNVSPCTGIESLSNNVVEIKSYPNPNTGTFTIESNAGMKLGLINNLGELVRMIELDETNGYRNTIEGLSSGIYILTGQANHNPVNQKIIVTQ